MEQPKSSRATTALLLALLVLAFLVRVAWRIHAGAQDFWTNGYSFLYDLATNLASGHGLVLEGDRAARMPLYPIFLSLTAFAGKNYLWIVIPQALIGAGTALCAFLIGRELFGASAGLLASALTAFYPYYVVHDTALQETGIFTFLTAFAVFLLLRASRSSTVVSWTVAGLVLGAAVLTRQLLLPFAALALVWIVFFGTGSIRQKFDRLISIGAPLCLIVGLWMARNYMVLGAPVMTSETGHRLWVANNPETFMHYPAESIARSAEDALAALAPDDRQDLDGISDEILKSDWFQDRAFDYMSAHPAETVRRAGQKILAGFSWTLNPARDPVQQWVYLVSYGPISILGVLGMALTWRQWKKQGLIYLLFLSFLGVTAVFLAHTSNRSFLDVYWIVFAAYVLNRFLGERLRKAPAAPA